MMEENSALMRAPNTSQKKIPRRSFNYVFLPLDLFPDAS
jgi:hypothetical protein